MPEVINYDIYHWNIKKPRNDTSVYSFSGVQLKEGGNQYGY